MEQLPQEPDNKQVEVVKANDSVKFDQVDQAILDIKRDGHGRWVKGQTGNPFGRPIAGESYKACLNRLSAHKIHGLAVREIISAKLIKKAIAGDLNAINMIQERLEGKASVQIDVGTKKSPLADLSDEELKEAINFIRAQKESKAAEQS